MDGEIALWLLMFNIKKNKVLKKPGAPLGLRALVKIILIAGKNNWLVKRTVLPIPFQPPVFRLRVRP